MPGMAEPPPLPTQVSAFYFTEEQPRKRKQDLQYPTISEPYSNQWQDIAKTSYMVPYHPHLQPSAEVTTSWVTNRSGPPPTSSAETDTTYLNGMLSQAYDPVLTSTSSSSSTDNNHLLTSSSSGPTASLDFRFMPSENVDPLGYKEESDPFDLHPVACQQTTAPCIDFDSSRSTGGLYLENLTSIHQKHQQQLIQSWVGATTETTLPESPSHSSTCSQSAFPAPVTPAFFSPSFLDSIHEDRQASHGSGFEQDQPLEWRSSPYSSEHFLHSSSAMTSGEDIPVSLSPDSPSNSSSSNYSPPITPMYNRLSIRPGPFHYSANHTGNNFPSHLSVAEADDYTRNYASRDTTQEGLHHIGSSNILDLKAGMVTARLMQNALNAAKMRPLIQCYLQSSDPMAIGERTVVILTSKVAQKSYGTEKRFLCPPPTAILVGTSWWTPRKQLPLDPCHQQESLLINDEVLAPPKLSVCISGESSSQPGQIAWYTVSGATVGQTGETKQTQHGQSAQLPDSHPNRFRGADTRNNNVESYCNQNHEPLAAGKCVSKHLYINDADEKRKRVECLVKIQLASGLTLGTLASKGIKVIICIHHGTTVSLFNRIRSQTVSTKYLGVSTTSSSPFAFPGNPQSSTSSNDSTCFVARTGSWDPFVIWIVDTTRAPGDAKEGESPEDYIGHGVYTRSTPYPPPPAIALKNTTNQLVSIHYNQHIVLQCLTTGLVSPVMIIRRVDKASTVVGGARCIDEMGGGGEYGDEALGDPVSQLHKIALQIVQDPAQTVQQTYLQDQDALGGIVMPRSSNNITYLACLNDMVGMHKTAEARKLILPLSPASTPTLSPSLSSSAAFADYGFDMSVTSQEGGKVVRKRRVSTDVLDRSLPGLNHRRLVSSTSLTDLSELNRPDATNSASAANFSLRRRVNSLNNDAGPYPTGSSASGSLRPSSHRLINGNGSRSRSISERKPSVSSSTSSTSSNCSITGSATTSGIRQQRRMSTASSNGNASNLGSAWSEDVSDTAVWTIVGTDCATYTFWSMQSQDQSTISSTPSSASTSSSSSSSSPFPSLSRYSLNTGTKDASFAEVMTLHGENFSRDTQVWFGDARSPQVDYRSRELLVCRIPPRGQLLQSVGLEQHDKYQLPILLVRGDGVVYKTNKFYQF
ncbi:hypothetical protein EC973_002734 [Apophysomyces ossiformis]|uniref:LAG1-DNAbind-domain-containing protein n=1 Tax=Apophysomyces ossiformis TaxID=679940 RepID=A0A8H7BN93_9FUNG|nr:hypothetical protein EC973_002734 [Apophysomyces ossiformis]